MGNFISIFVVLPLLGSNSFDEPKQLKLKDDSFFFLEQATDFIASTKNGYLTNRWTQFYVAVGCGKEEQRNS